MPGAPLTASMRFDASEIHQIELHLEDLEDRYFASLASGEIDEAQHVLHHLLLPLRRIWIEQFASIRA